jgi:N-ethylmaleimide reductase
MLTTPNPLMKPLELGGLTLPNRIVMAPLTRNRASAGADAPHALNAEYYAQRATAGLIISEGTQISPEGKGYFGTPGIYSAEQVAGWRLVTDAVHRNNGRIFAQLWHVGRISHTSLLHGQAPVGPTAVAANAKTFDGAGFVDVSTPRALSVEDIARLAGDYRRAALNAKEAGFDGIELHAANGYLIDQFLRDSVNTRSDRYGGSVENRTRLLTELLQALTDVWAADRIGVRFSPFSSFGDISDSDPMTTFGHAIAKASGFGLGYLHMVEGETGGSRILPPGASIAALRGQFQGAYMANNGYDRQMAMDAVGQGAADLVAFGQKFIANPDLVERLAHDAPLNPPHQETFYGGGAEGYTDYPALAA